MEHPAILCYDGNNRRQKTSQRNSSNVESELASPQQFRSPSQCPVPWPAPPLHKLSFITSVTVAQALHIHTSSVFLHQQICRCLAQALSQKDPGSTWGSHLSIRPWISNNLSKAPFPHRKSGSHNNTDLTRFLQNSDIYKFVSTSLMSNSKHALLQAIFPTKVRTCISLYPALTRRFFTTSATWEAQTSLLAANIH